MLLHYLRKVEVQFGENYTVLLKQVLFYYLSVKS